MLILTLFCFFTIMWVEGHSPSDVEKFFFFPPDWILSPTPKDSFHHNFQQRICLAKEGEQGQGK